MSMFIQEAQRTAWLGPEEDGKGGLHWLRELIELTLEGLQGHGQVQLPVPEQEGIPSGYSTGKLGKQWC